MVDPKIILWTSIKKGDIRLFYKWWDDIKKGII